MKKVFLISFIVITSNLLAQEKVNTTSQFNVEGKIRNRLSLSQNDLSVFPSHPVDSIMIYNHMMQPRKTIKNIKGVLLKDILDKAGIDVNSLKLLIEF